MKWVLILLIVTAVLGNENAQDKAVLKTQEPLISSTTQSSIGNTNTGTGVQNKIPEPCPSPPVN
jgi:hypothetical protein